MPTKADIQHFIIQEAGRGPISLLPCFMFVRLYGALTEKNLAKAKYKDIAAKARYQLECLVKAGLLLKQSRPSGYFGRSLVGAAKLVTYELTDKGWALLAIQIEKDYEYLKHKL